MSVSCHRQQSKYLFTEFTLWIINNVPIYIYIDDAMAVTQHRSQSMNEYIP